MRTWQVIYLRPNGADIGRLSSVKSNIFVQQQVPNCFFLCSTNVLTQHEAFRRTLLITEGIHELFFQFIERSLSLFFRFALHSSCIKLVLQKIIDTCAHIFIMVFMAVFTLNTIMTCRFCKSDLSFTLRNNGCVGSFNGIHHFIFAHFMHLTFNHDNAVNGSSNHHVHIRQFQFRTQRIDDEFTIYTCNTNF